MNSKTYQLDLAMAFEFGDDRPILPNEAVLESGEVLGVLRVASAHSFACCCPVA